MRGGKRAPEAALWAQLISRYQSPKSFTKITVMLWLLPFVPFWDEKKLDWVTADALAMLQDHLYCRRRVIEIRNQSFRRGFDSKAWTDQMEDLARFARKGMREADYLLTRRTPAFLRMMRRAGHSPSISPLLAERLTGHGETSFLVSASPFLELTPSAPSTPRVLSLTRRSSRSLLEANFATNSPVAEPSRTPILSADIGVLGATPSVIGCPTMTELVEEFMEDLLTREFCPTLLDEDI